MGTSKDILIDRVFELEQEVKKLEEKKHIYVHETHTIWADHGELNLECEQGTITFNMKSLFNDLPIFIQYCIKDQEENKKEVLKQIEILTKKI